MAINRTQARDRIGTSNKQMVGRQAWRGSNTRVDTQWRMDGDVTYQLLLLIIAIVQNGFGFA